jgi:hypothetical protein
MRERPVEHAPAALVLVHAELDEAADEAAALGNAENERMVRPGDFAAAAHRRIDAALGIDALVAQERHEIAGRGEPHAHYLRRGGIVPQFIDRERREPSSHRHEMHGAVTLEAPGVRGNVHAWVAFPFTHGEPGDAVVEVRGRIAQFRELAVRIAAGAELELLADAANDRLAVVGGDGEAGGQSVVGTRRVRVPARPHDGVAAAERKSEAGIKDGAGLVVVPRRSSTRVSSALRPRLLT